MFEDLVDSPALHEPEKTTQESMKEIRNNLNSIAPDFVAFVEKFGSVDVGEGHFRIYGWVQDLSEFFEQNMGEKPEVDAWLFGDDYSGDFHAIDKKTGEVVFISAGYLELDEIRFPSFEKFIRHLLRE